jgi:hypothetical protein
VSTHGHAAESRPSVSARGFLRPRVLAFVGLLALIVVVANSCQNSQVRLSQQQAIALARQQVDFVPTRTQVRLVRQGIQSSPIWAISLSVPTGPDQFDKLAVVRIDANKGKVLSVATQRAPAPAVP